MQMAHVSAAQTRQRCSLQLLQAVYSPPRHPKRTLHAVQSHRGQALLWRRAAVAHGARRRPPACVCAASAADAAAHDIQADVAVVGAGIIGLCTSLTLLRADPSLRVVLLDREVPCCGATGAGQGYLWLAHRQAGGPLWQHAVRSLELWHELLADGDAAALTPAAVEWQSLGSLLLACSADESAALQERQAALENAGVDARWLPAAEVLATEPALRLPADGSALLVPADAQVNGRQTAAALQAACEAYGPRFTALFHEPVEGLLLADVGTPSSCMVVVEGVSTSARRVTAPRGVVVAAGAWSGKFLAAQLGRPEWSAAFAPRKGLLLEMPRPAGMPPLHTAMMEQGYTKHYSAAGAASSSGQESEGQAAADITFTATTSASGSLLVGSSRQFCGYGKERDEQVVDSIMQRAAQFLPGLADVAGADIDVRAGPRPWAAAGKPMVGPVPGAGGLYIAAGHEGSGLTLGPATAELLSDYVLGRPPEAGAHVADALACSL